jgi:DNA-binding HxlR family transcriptional regulator
MKYSEMTQGCARSRCPIANTLDIIGDKWTLLIIRDMLLLGAGQYQDFLRAPEKISTNILADRLKKLEAAGLIDKAVYQTNPVRHMYSLSAKGEALRPIILEMVKWGGAYVDGAFAPSAEKIKEIEQKAKSRAA